MIAILIIDGILLLALLCSILLALRNRAVYRYRLLLLDCISPRLFNFRDLINAYESVSYTDMLYKFWIPLQSFYRGTPLEHIEPEHGIISKIITTVYKFFEK